MEKYSTTNDGLEELKDIVTGALDRVRNGNLHLTYTQCETLVKKLLKKCFCSIEIVSKEERLVHNLSRLVGKPKMWFPNRSDTNQAVQSQKQARSFKFRI